jgi:membrane dipeptidase
MRDGGIGAQFFSLVSLPIVPHAGGLTRAVNEQIDILNEFVLRGPQDIRLARTAAEVERCRRDGVIAALLGIEGAHALEGDLDKIHAFACRGVRYLGLLHFSANDAGYPAYGSGRRDEQGLTPWGFELIRRCEAENVLVDLSHINRRGFLDACRVASRPPIVSHTGVLGAHKHWRNIDDDQLRAVADKGGVVGVIFYPRYLGGEGLEPVVKHFMHILNVVGEDAPALGSDWDGFIVPTRQLSDPGGLPLLTDALLRAGVTERALSKILRGNVLRILS